MSEGSPMVVTEIYKLLPFDTGRYEGHEFLMANGNATLAVHVAELSPVKIQFERIRWHEFTALYNCSPVQVSSAYFELVELVQSKRLIEYVGNDRATAKAYRELHHYQIFLDESGCHEVFAQSWQLL
jgi:hypothetical protein